MGVFQQLGLLLKKNALLRRRNLSILALEVVWPILIVGIIALMRAAISPKESPTCHYQERALPSAGLVPFIQTFVCNLDNKCHSEESRQTAQQAAANVSALVADLSPYLSDEETLEALDVVDDSVVLISSFTDLAQDDELMDQLQNASNIAQYFRDPDKVKAMLVRDFGFSQQAADALMDSQLNLTAILDLTGYPDLRAVACDEKQLGMYLKFPPGADVAMVSRTLCNINDSKIPEVTRVLQEQLDVAQIVRLLGMFESLKERLNVPNTWQLWLRDIADMLDLMFSIGDLKDTVRAMAGISSLPDLVRQIPVWVDTLAESGSLVQPLQGLLESLDPLLTQFFPNDTIWGALKDGMALAPQVAGLLDGQSNVTSAKVMEDMAAFLKDLESIFTDLPPEVLQMLDTFSAMDWPRIWELMSTLGNDNTTLDLSAEQIEMILKQTPWWGDISHYVAMVTDIMHSINSLLGQLLDAQASLQDLQAEEDLKQMLDLLMARGPNVTLAVLRAFTHPDTLAVLLTEEPVFSKLCADVMAAVVDDIGAETAAELNSTLCHASTTAFNSQFDQMGINDISVAVNQTVWVIMDALSGQKMYGSANLSTAAKEVEHFLDNFGRMLNMTATTWGELLSVQEMLKELADKHAFDWEPVLDMMNENYLGSVMVGFGRAMDGVMNNTQVQRMFGPTVHVASIFARTFYNEMERMNDMLSLNAPLPQLVYYSTNYAPELAGAIMKMGTNGNIDMVYDLASSRDPLKTLCEEHMMEHLGLPDYVPAADMQTVVCSTNWTAQFAELVSMQSLVQVMVEEVMAAMSDLENPNVTYSFEADWVELTDYANKIVIMLPEMNLEKMLSSGPWSLVDYANFTQVAVALDYAMKAMGTMDNDDLNYFAGIVVRALENIDSQMSEGIPVFGEGSIEEWRLLKHYAVIVDDFNALMTTYNTYNPQATYSLNVMLEEYPSEIRSMVELAAGAYLEFIDVLKRLILKPDQLLSKLVRGGVQVPSCGGTTVAWILDLEPDSYLGRLEATVCNTNWTAIAMELGNQQPEVNRIVDELTVLMGDLSENKIDPSVNWTQVVNNMIHSYNQYSNALANMTWPMTFDLSPFNMTAINMKWADFVRDMDQLNQMDTESLMKTFSDLQSLLMANMSAMLGMENNGGNDTFTWLGFFQIQNYLNYHIMLFTNRQLHYMNSTTHVNVLDLLGSDELRKAAEVLRYSPEINAIGIQTLIRLLNDYTQYGTGRIVTEPDQFTSLCSNLTLFSWVVAVDDSVMDTELLQKTVCNLNINLTVLVEELRQNWDGFAELLDALSQIEDPEAYMSLDYTEITEAAAEYSKLLEYVIQHPPMFSLFPDDERWMNMTLYETEWSMLGEKFEDLFRQYQGTDEDWRQMIGGVFSGLMASQESRMFLYGMDASLDLMLHLMEAMEDGVSSFDNFPNLLRMYNLLQQFPELMEMVIYTVTQHQEQVNAWGAAMVSWETFCAADPTTLMTAPPDSRLDVADVFGHLCAINITQLMVELSSYRGFTRLQNLLEGGHMEPLDNAALERKLVDFVEHFENQMSPNTTVTLRMLNETVWKGVFARLGRSLNDTLQAYMAPATFYNMMVELLGMIPEMQGIEGFVNQSLALADIILDQTLRSLEGGTLQELFDTYPTVQSVLKLTDSLPELVETLVYTGLFTSGKISQNPEAFASFEAFCATDLNTLLTVPDEITFDLSAWQRDLCAINITLLMEELADYQGTREMQRILEGNSTVTVDVTAISQKVERVMERLMTFGVNETDMTQGARFLNASAWEGVVAHLEVWAQNASAMMGSPEWYMMMLSNPALMQQLGVFMQPSMAVSMVIMEKMLLYENKTSFTLDELFVGAPELQKLLQLMQEPGVFEVLFESSSSPKFEPVIASNNVTVSFYMLCHPSTSLSQYLTVPDGVTVDLDGLKPRLCALDPELIEQEFMNFLDIDRISAAMNGSVPVDMMEYARQQERVSAMIARWIESPPTFTLPANWENETFWLQMLERYYMKRQDPAVIAKEMESLLPLLANMPGHELQQFGLVMETLVHLMNENLVALQNQNLTLENMFEVVPVLRDVLSALGIEGEVFDALKVSPVRSQELLVEAMLSDGSSAYRAICEGMQIEDMLELPPSFNTTALYELVCLRNATNAVDSLVRNLNLQQILHGLASQSPMANLSVVFSQSIELQRNIENLMRHPPSFNASSLLTMLEAADFMTTDLWRMTSGFGPLFNLLRQVPGFDAVESMLKGAAVVNELLDDLVNRLVIDGKTLDLASLFSGSPSFVRLVEAVLHAQPDPFTALSTIQLSPAKNLEFADLVSDPSSVETLLCSESEFRDFFIVPDGVNVTEILHVLCKLNFTEFVEELGDNFMVDSLTRKFTMAMNGSEHFNVQSYIATYMNLMEHITTLTGVNNVTFNGNSLDRAFSINETAFLNALTSMSDILNEENLKNLANLADSLEPLFSSMANSSDGQTIVLVFKILETYLHSLNQELAALMNGPITMAAIMNNTEAGKIALPFLQDPAMLEELLSLEMLPDKLSALFMEEDLEATLCGPKLFSAFVYPGNESAALHHLQTSTCNANLTVLLWQAIMGQANGYQLYLQFGRLSEEIAAGKVTVNSTAISSEVERLVSMVMQIASEYGNGTRSIDNLLDWEAFGRVLNRFGTAFTDRFMNSTDWSSMWSTLPEFEGSDFMARTINTANIFMEIINDRLRDVIANNVSMLTLLGHSQTLADLLDAYLDVTQMSVQAWMDQQFSMERVLGVLVNMTAMDEMCESRTLAAYLADTTTPVPEIAVTMETVMCSMTTTLPEAFLGFINYTAIEEKLEMIWNMSLPAEVQFQRYQHNIQTMVELVEQLVHNGLSVDASLAGRFDINNMFDALMDITQNPEMIFRLMKAFGILIDGPLSTNDQQNMFYGINAYIAQPLLLVTEKLQYAGITWSSVMSDPSVLLEALPVMADFATQFEVLASVYLQPTMNIIWNNKEFRDNHFCNGSLPDEVFVAAGLEPSIVDSLCQLPPTQWIEELQKHGASAMQIYTFVAKVQQAYNRISYCHSSCPADGPCVEVCGSRNADLFPEGSMNWLRLMTTMEALAKHMTPTDEAGNVHNMTDPMSRLWNVMENVFMDKLFHGGLNYLEMQDRAMFGQVGNDWLAFKQFIKFLDSAVRFFNTYLHGMTGPAGTVSLESMLPDSDKVAALIADIFGQSSAAEVLAASVNPQMFYYLAYSSRLQEFACDAREFNNLFTFEAGTDVAAIQQSLCAAATNRSVSLQELVDLFQAGDMLRQLDRLFVGNYSSVVGDFSLWRSLFDVVSAMVRDLEQIQQGDLNATVSMAWLSPVLDQLTALNQPSESSLETMCEDYVTFMRGSAWFSNNVGMLNMMAGLMDVARSSAPFIPLMDDVMCAMVTEDHLDLAAGVEVLKQHGLHDFFQQLANLLSNGTDGTFQCRALIHSGMELYEAFNATLMSGDLDFERLGQCMQRGSPLFADVMSGINQIYQVAVDVFSMLDEGDFRLVMANSGPLGEMLEFMLSILTREQPVALRFEDLLANRLSVEEYLMEVLRLAPETVDSILASTINFNSSALLNRTVGEIAAVLCDPLALASVMDPPAFAQLSVAEISSFLCSGNVNVTAAVFKDARQSVEFVAQLVTMLTQDVTGVFMANFTTNLVDLFSQLQGLSALLDLFADGIDFDHLRENADAIDQFIMSGSVQHLVDSVANIVGDLRYVVPEQDHYMITDLQTFIRGLIGLDFIQSYLLQSIQVSDLVKDVRAVRNYFINDLDFSPRVADALLNSIYSIRVFLNVSDVILSEKPCSVKLNQFLVLNNTEALNAEITSSFCSLNTSQATELLEALAPELSIGSLVQRYVTYSGEQFLVSVNMTQDRVRDVVDKLSKGSQVLGEAAYLISGRDSTHQDVLNDIFDITGEFDALVSLEPVMCGRSSNVRDDFGVGDFVGPSSDSETDYDGGFGSSDSSGGGGGDAASGSDTESGSSSQTGATATSTASPQQSTIKTVYAARDDFCRDLYRKIRASTMGPVIMAYLKPIMGGKILYTPSNPVTDAIVQEANWVFDTLSEVKRVSKIWAEKGQSLSTLTDQAGEMDQIKDTLSNSFVQRVLQSSVGVDSQALLDGLDSVSKNKFNTSQIDALQKVAQLVYNYTTCLELRRFHPVSSEAKMEEMAWELFKVNRFLGGIVFLDMPDTNSRKKRQADTNLDIPTHIKYKIRMDMDNVPSTHRLKDRLWMPDPEDSFSLDLRYMRGFMQLQDMIEGAIVRLQAKDANFNATAVLMQQMPFPCHTEDDYIHFLGSYLLSVVMTFAWLASLGIATHNLVYDRQNGQEESLRMMGMVSGLNVLAWAVFTLLLMAAVSFIITLIFTFGGIFINSNWVIIFLYLLAFCLSTTMMCYFISAFFTRVTLAILSMIIIYFITFLPFIVLLSAEVQMEMWQKTLACLSSTTAFSFGAVFITRFEEETSGIQWSNMDDKLTDSVSFSFTLYMMLIDSAIYLILGWYVRGVKPGKYGIPQPWYFPVCPSYWCGSCKGSTKTLPPPSTSKNPDLYEADPPGLDVGISVRGLRKEYSNKEEALKSLDVDIYHDQVTTLLGHNGAAKTTTLNMMMGVLSPSSGVVLVEGKKSTGKTGLLGICPQHNALFEYMTVMEHMEFYSGVKGHMSFVERSREIRKLLHDVDLYHVKDVPAKHLSGGMQRRLCVALAFVGGSRTIILDEPTSGVDPHARKNIWNMIMRNRPGRTILMSTHHLDEADMLSDRILVLHRGRLLCLGSPAFLKNQLGGGYKLTINTYPMHEEKDEVEMKVKPAAIAAPSEVSSQHQQIISFVAGCLPGSTFMESVGTDLTICLPQDSWSTATLCHFFKQFDRKARDLGILGYGISNTTLEEVFLRITTQADSESDASGHTRNSASAETESLSSGSDNTILRSSTGRPKRSVTGPLLKMQQLLALLVKRVHHFRRNWRMVFSTLVLPLLAFTCALAFSTLRPKTEEMPSILISPALYAPNTYAFFKDESNSDFGHSFASMLAQPDPGLGTTCMEGFDAGKRFKCVTPGSWANSSKKVQICKCDDYSYECNDGSAAEGVRNIVSRPDVTLQDLAGHNLNQYLVDSYAKYIDQRFGGWSIGKPTQEGNTTKASVKVWFNNKGHHALPSYFNAFSNNLLRTAVGPSGSAQDYGITLYNHPLMLNEEQLSDDSIESAATDVGIAMVVLLALSFIPSAFMVYLMNERLSSERHTQAISGVGTVLYWSASFIWDMFVYSVTLAIMVAIVVAFRTEGFYNRENLKAFTLLVFLYGWAVIPAMYCTLRVFKSGSSAYMVLFCLSMLIGILTTVVIFVISLLRKRVLADLSSSEVENLNDVYDVCKYAFLVFPQFCLGSGLVDLITNQVQYELLARFGEDTYLDPFSFDMLAWNFVALAAEGLVAFIAALIIHSRKSRAQSLSSHMEYIDKGDEDVVSEYERVKTGGSGDAIVIRDLSKVYLRGRKKFCAVNRISFGVSKGECFGLLGVNGAGKTTTFKMLTGGTTPSLGKAVVDGKDLDGLSLREEVGYCPQEDALDMYLSGRELLHFHARLRGFASGQAEQVIREQLERLHLVQYADKAVHTYSGGTRRKLNLAVAMLGDPPVLLLDEPTTGMDPGTRRLAWKCITTATQRGQAVILTSHTMDECDTLCSRIGIMVNGQLKCLGSPQHLKNKFGDGYTVILHLQGLSSNRFSIAEAFLSQFPGSVIKDQHHSVVEVSIPRGAGSVADIFSALQRAQAENQIAYYSVSQTTLDTIFVSFAQEQTDDSEHDLDSGSSSGSSRGSLSHNDSYLQKSVIGGNYAYMNPEYVDEGGRPLKEQRVQRMDTPPFAYENPAYSDQLFATKL